MAVIRFRQPQSTDTPARLCVGVLVLCLAASGCSSKRYITPRPLREHALDTTLQYFSWSGPKISGRTRELLTRYGLIKLYEDDPAAALDYLQKTDLRNPQQLYAIAEVAYILGHRAQRNGDGGAALQRYGTTLIASYRYLVGPELADERNVFDPQFRRAADLYNEALEDSLRLLCAKEALRPGQSYTVRGSDRQMQVRTVAHGPWKSDDFAQMKFVSDYRIQQLNNRHTTFGLGVPLIAVRPNEPVDDIASGYYPDGLSFAVTALLRCPTTLPAGPEGYSAPGMIGDMGPRPPLTTCIGPEANECVLELFDPLAANQVQIYNRWVPLETDLTTPLAFFLDSPQFRKKNMATAGLLNPEARQEARGLFMLEPYDPQRIPVLMVHGLWSSPLTWMDMFNDLRSFPELRQRYQFWFYLYPTGQPFWISAVQLRKDLDEAKRQLTANGRKSSLNQMVLVGHSMGGLLSRLQTIDSGDDFWKIVSDRPKDELKASPEDFAKLTSALYFRPNQAVRRVITIGTPHRGSDFANNYTRWLGQRFIKLPSFVRDTGGRLTAENPGFFKNTELLTTTTSIDSLAPESPIFPVMLRAKKAPWVKSHNIVGVVTDDRILTRLSGRGDGVVSFESAHLGPNEAASEKVVAADHQTIHTMPETILEVRRILLEHLQEIDSQDRVAEASESPSRMVAPVGAWEAMNVQR